MLDDRIDVDTLDEMAGLLQEEFSSMLETYLQETSLLMQGVHAAVAEEDVDAVAAAAHQIKSSSAYLGMVKLSELAAGLELRCGSGPDEGMGDVVAELEAEFEFVADYLMNEFGVEAP